MKSAKRGGATTRFKSNFSNKNKQCSMQIKGIILYPVQRPVVDHENNLKKKYLPSSWPQTLVLIHPPFRRPQKWKLQILEYELEYFNSSTLHRVGFDTESFSIGFFTSFWPLQLVSAPILLCALSCNVACDA